MLHCRSALGGFRSRRGVRRRAAPLQLCLSRRLSADAVLLSPASRSVQMDDRPTLASAGQVYITLAAARTYAQATGRGEEEARRELTELLLEARLRAPATVERPAEYRYRSRALRTDITARVVVEGSILVVVAVSVREYRQTRETR